jgi:plasmid stabilization system protein ParE
MKIVIRETADADLDSIDAWIEKDNPRAAVEASGSKLEPPFRRSP